MNNKLNQEHQEVPDPADLYEREKVPAMFGPLAQIVCWKGNHE